LDWQQYVKVDERFLRPLNVEFLQRDYSKAKQKLGWQPKVKFSKLVEIMVREERFAWDAPNYPGEARILTRALKV